MISNRRRKEIYTEALDLLKASQFFKGMCFFIQLSFNHGERITYTIYDMPELKCQVPEGIVGICTGYWFPLNEQGKQERIKVLENAILKIK